MPQHTPDPWWISPDNDCCVLGQSEDDPPYQITVAQAYGFMGIREANARLIAAAPELLKALKGLLEAVDSPDNYPDEYRNARMVVRKAEGK